MNAITTAYNYYMTTYAPKTNKSRYGAHKQSELKDVYNSIVKMSKDSPTYLFDTSKSVYKYAVNIKEEALGLKDALTAFTNSNDPKSIIGRKIATSDSPDLIDINLVDNNSSGNNAYELEISNLAKPQVNIGKYLEPDALGLLPNDYSFDLRVDNTSYEFQFHVSHTDTNNSIETRLSNLINNSDIGITASIVTDENGKIALSLASDQTGEHSSDGYSLLFEVTGNSELSNDIINYLGINQISQHSEDAVCTVDGEEHSSSTNSVTINNEFQVDFKNTTQPEQSIHIGYKTDIDTISDNIKSLISQYNSMLETSGQYSTDNKVQTRSLTKDLTGITSRFHNSLESIGLNLTEDGHMEVDDSLLYQALDEDLEDTVQTIFNFKSALVNKTDKILLNPMEYVNRTIVTYPNPGKTFPNPYMTSIYSGMLFNSYC